MSEPTDMKEKGEGEPRCDCGYACRGATLHERVRDGQRHAREVHGIDVSLDQVLAREDDYVRPGAQPVDRSGLV